MFLSPSAATDHRKHRLDLRMHAIGLSTAYVKAAKAPLTMLV